MFTSLITTMNRVTEDVKTESGIIDPTKSLVGIDACFTAH